MTNQINAKFSIGLQGAYKLEVCDDNNMVIKDYGWKPNLILNIGLDQFNSSSIATLTTYCHLGSGLAATEPLEYLGGAITASWTGNTVTFSGAGCPNLVQYRTIKFIEDNVAAFITAVGSVNSVTVRETAAAPITNNTFIIYTTERTKLVAQAKNTNTTSINTTDMNQSTKVATYVKQYDFAVETLNMTYTECGVSWQNPNPSLLWSRIIFDTPVSVPISKKLRVTYSLSASFYPVLNPVNTIWDVTGWTLSAGQALLEYLNDYIYPVEITYITISSDATALQNRSAAYTYSGYQFYGYKMTYIANSFYQLSQANLETADGNSVGNIRGIGLGGSSTTNKAYYKFLYNTVSGVAYNTKNSDYVLSLMIKKSWGRIV